MKEVHHNFKNSDLNVYFKRNLVDEIDEEKIANDAEWLASIAAEKDGKIS